MSRQDPYVVSDEDEDPADDSYEVIDLIDDDSDSDDELEITGARAKTPISPVASSLKRRDLVQWPLVELQRYKLSNGCRVAPGDTVELYDENHDHDPESLHSGDFLRIRHIVKNVETGEVCLRGHRLKRNKYMGQLFLWKLNELAMVLRVREGDTNCPFVAGLEDIAVQEVLRTRECNLTNKPYPFRTFRDVGGCAFPASLSKDEIKQQIFHGGLLACRVVQVTFISKNGKPYSGIVRRLYTKEADPTTAMNGMRADSTSSPESILLSDDDEGSSDRPTYDLSKAVSNLRRRARSTSIDHGPRKRRSPPMPTKRYQYTFGDAFCGAGGASQGAKQAGLSTTWAMDFDEHAIWAYSENHPCTQPFQQNAHDFPPEGYTGRSLRVDVLHLSPPCCFFSPANTRKYSAEGSAQDQANLEALFTVGPILHQIKPRVATLEQTFGLSTFKEHRKYFLMLLNDIGTAGYDLRYKLENLSQFGLVQPRKRLLIIAARLGQPLPPFPKPTHGPPGSGLKRFQTIRDALVPIERLGSRPTDDQYHQPKRLKVPKEPYDSRRFLKGCVTKGGGLNYHPSGLRNFTPRELGLLQSFPMTYKFCGSQTEAKKQIGNAFPPIMAEAMFRTIAKTLEAFDKEHIGAEDDIDDIDSFLERKGVRLQPPPAAPRAVFNPTHRPLTLQSRYLMRDDRPQDVQAVPTYSSPFARNHVNVAQTSRAPAPRAPAPAPTPRTHQGIDLLEGLLDDLTSSEDDEVVESVETRPSRRPSRRVSDTTSDIIEISEDDENSESIETRPSHRHPSRRVTDPTSDIIEISSESEESDSEESGNEEEDEGEDDSWVHVRDRRSQL